MIEFNVAAEAEEVAEDEDVVEVPIGAKVFQARRPTVAQIALLNGALGAKGRQRLEAAYVFIEALMGPDARTEVESLVLDRRIDFGDLIGGSDRNPDGGLIDMILSEFSGRPTEPSTASSQSRSSGGRKSTGRSPGKGSTRSSSPSTDS